MNFLIAVLYYIVGIACMAFGLADQSVMWFIAGIIWVVGGSIWLAIDID